MLNYDQITTREEPVSTILMFRSSSEAEALEALLTGGQIPGLVINDDIRPKSVSAGFHYFSDNGEKIKKCSDSSIEM